MLLTGKLYLSFQYGIIPRDHYAYPTSASVLNPDDATATSTPAGTPSPTTGAPTPATFTGMAMPMKTGAVVPAALFGAGVAVMNF
jgi:hypothetical protein